MLGVGVPAVRSLAEAFCPSCRPVSLRPAPLVPMHSNVVPRQDEGSFVQGCLRRSLNRIIASSAPLALPPHKSSQMFLSHPRLLCAPRSDAAGGWRMPRKEVAPVRHIFGQPGGFPPPSRLPLYPDTPTRQSAA